MHRLRTTGPSDVEAYEAPIGTVQRIDTPKTKELRNAIGIAALASHFASSNARIEIAEATAISTIPREEAARR